MLANAAYSLNKLYECLGIRHLIFDQMKSLEMLILQSVRDGMGRNSHATVQKGINEVIRLTLTRLIDA